MNRFLTLSGALATTIALSAGLAFAQSKPADCKAGRMSAPEKVEGQVVNVDQNSGKVTIREKNGSTHEFQANRETLQDMKPGDQIEARLREAPKC